MCSHEVSAITGNVTYLCRYHVPLNLQTPFPPSSPMWPQAQHGSPTHNLNVSVVEDRLRLKAQPHHVAAVGFWGSYLTSLSLSFLFCKMVANDSSYLLEVKWNECVRRQRGAGVGSVHCAPGITVPGEEVGADATSSGLFPGDHVNSGLPRPRSGRKVCIWAPRHFHLPHLSEPVPLFAK